MLLPFWRIMLGCWLTAVLLVISLPWPNFDGTPHWNSVQWVPFTHLNWHRAVLAEAALNMLAFVPVGYLSVRSAWSLKWSPLFVACLLGFASSFGIETYQLFCFDRVPSTSDVLMNGAGTACGVWLANAIDRMLTWCSLPFRRVPTGLIDTP
jgi:glycopeptide antibiotics resistance protein